LIDAGFDGIYLDWIEAYDDKAVIAAAEADGLDARQEMIWWVSDLADYGRERNQNFIVIAQNAAELATHADYVDAIDAIAQEQTWFDGGADNDPPGDCPLPENDSDIESKAYESSLTEACYDQYLEFPDSTLHVSSAWYIDNLLLAQSKGLTIFTIDYAVEEDNIEWVYETSRSYGFIPFVSNRWLNEFKAPVP
jgi:cysteinyl-tRNA synthetase, unknown class